MGEEKLRVLKETNKKLKSFLEKRNNSNNSTILISENKNTNKNLL